MFKNDSILRGHTSINTAYEVKDYPYGFRLRTSIFYWIETKKGKGDRFCSYTIDPKTGRKNTPKCSTYSPFLYMYINEKGHVDTGKIDSYDTEEFRLRFDFITERIGVEFISEDQKYNLRIEHAAHLRANYPYIAAKYSDEMKPVYKKWVIDTVKHILNCDFKDVVNYPDPPEQDNPDGEVKAIVTTYEPKKEPELTHSITVEKIQSMLNNILPGFTINVSEYDGFAGNYMKIAACLERGKQAVSLSLNLKNLNLEPQMYGGLGGQSIYRLPNPEDPKERYNVMSRIKIPFRRPQANEKDVLAAIERFFKNYKAALIENRSVLYYQNEIDYNKYLN